MSGILRRFSPRELRRFMQQAGVKMDSLADVTEVVIKMPGKELVILEPQVNVIEIRGEKFFQITGSVSERTIEEEVKISDEDVQLVAQQANVSFEEAKEALKETKGDLARAILLLKQRR